MSDDARFEVSDSEALGELDEETPRRRGLRAAMSIVWMVLLAAGYIWQNCAGGPS